MLTFNHKLIELITCICFSFTEMIYLDMFFATQRTCLVLLKPLCDTFSTKMMAAWSATWIVHHCATYTTHQILIDGCLIHIFVVGTFHPLMNKIVSRKTIENSYTNKILFETRKELPVKMFFSSGHYFYVVQNCV
jgi:hypothetical protein